MTSGFFPKIWGENRGCGHYMEKNVQLFFFLGCFQPYLPLLNCSNRLYWGKRKTTFVTFVQFCKDVIPHPCPPPLLVASSNSPLSKITEVVLHSIKFVRNSRDLEIFLHRLEGNPAPRFEIPVACIHKGLPLQPSSRCCLVGSEAAAKFWRLCFCAKNSAQLPYGPGKNKKQKKHWNSHITQRGTL